jgi:hypothetical protein
MDDGLYFGLDEATYHALPALSASGIKNLLISPMDFWARSWLNPLKPTDEEGDDQPEWKIVGHAYHKRILEGRDAFADRYAPTFEALGDCLKTIDDIKEAMSVLGVETKGCKSKADYIARLREADPDVQLFDELRNAYAEEHEGKEFLSADLIAKIELSAAMIEKHPEISKCFRGGYPEVTVIWNENGIRFKARLDYLKPRAIIDLKTFTNMMNKPIEGAIYSAMASKKYHIQSAHYMRGAIKAVEFVRLGRVITSDLSKHGPDETFLRELAKTAQHDFFFVFQQKGIAPLARAKKFTRGSLWSCGEVAIEEAIKRYRFYMDKHGENEPWVDAEPITDFEDALFPAYTTEL